MRNRASEIASLLGDIDKIRQERRKAKANKTKYGGQGNDGGMSFTTASGGRYGGFGSDSLGSGGGGGGGGSSGGGYRGGGDYDSGDGESITTRSSLCLPGYMAHVIQTTDVGRPRPMRQQPSTTSTKVPTTLKSPVGPARRRQIARRDLSLRQNPRPSLQNQSRSPRRSTCLTLATMSLQLHRQRLRAARRTFLAVTVRVLGILCI